MFSSLRIDYMSTRRIQRSDSLTLQQNYRQECNVQCSAAAIWQAVIDDWSMDNDICNAVRRTLNFALIDSFCEELAIPCEIAKKKINSSCAESQKLTNATIPRLAYGKNVCFSLLHL